MENSNHTYRMYVLVERHLSPLDKGIQAAHAIVEYGNTFGGNKSYRDWSERDKTIIVLSGGVCKDLEADFEMLRKEGIYAEYFKEEDLNDIVTAVAFIADERVYDKKNYPDYEVWKATAHPVTEYTLTYPQTEIHADEYKAEWVEFIGGKEIATIREVLNGKHLAR